MPYPSALPPASYGGSVIGVIRIPQISPGSSAGSIIWFGTARVTPVVPRAVARAAVKSASVVPEVSTW